MIKIKIKKRIMSNKIFFIQQQKDLTLNKIFIFQEKGKTKDHL